MTATNGRRKYRTRRVYRDLPGDLAWKILDETLDAVNRYRDGLCARCGENIRVQGDCLCLECFEEADELGLGDDDMARELWQEAQG